MSDLVLPAPLDDLVDTLASMLDARHADLLEPLFLGALLAHGRRTATSWFRAGGMSEAFKRGYTLLGTLGRRYLELFPTILFGRIRRTIEPGRFWLFGIDDTPTERYGPEVEGAGIHHNPTPGPTHQPYVYGHVWVTLDWIVRHPENDVFALPLLGDLYIRREDVAKIAADRRPTFHTKLESAVAQMHWIDKNLPHRDKPVWLVVDGAYTKHLLFQTARALNIVLVGRLPKNAALHDVPRATGPRRRGRPRIYGKKRFSLAKRAGHAQGWETVECFQYQRLVTKRIKTFLATWGPAGGAIRVVIVKEESSWRAYCCTDLEASVVDILESAAGRTALEQTNKDIKEVEGAGQQQLRYWRANAGAFNWCLWSYTAVEWWAWPKPLDEVVDRSGAPWDETERRASHAEKRKALQRECLREGFWRAWGDEPRPPKIEAWLDVLLDLVA